MRVHGDNQPGSLVSICIPTYKRPDLLREALNSCMAQSYRDYEIVIGDDSPDDRTAKVVSSFDAAHPGRLRYHHHRPGLGQNENVNDLLARARGRLFMLLHDDDLLLPEALELLVAAWHRQPLLDAAFGKQLLVNHDGSLRPQVESDELNQLYARVPVHAGLQHVPVIAGIRRMFPNDGFITRTELARSIGYRPKSEVGDACDTDFGLRLCAQAEQIWFVDAFTTKYRLSEESISKGAFPAPYAHAGLRALQVPAAAETSLRTARRELAPDAVSGWAQLGETRRAAAVYFSQEYPLRVRLSRRGAYHVFLMLRSLFQRSPSA